MNDWQTLQKVAFLDTNTLHYIGIYLEYARDRNLYPQGAKEEAIQSVNEQAEADLRRRLRQGLETVAFLSDQDVDIQVQYSPVSELELLTGRTKGKAIISAAKEGLPDRMWSRFREEEIRERVGTADLEEVKHRVDSLTSLLEESGIAVKIGDSNQTSEVLELAKGINGLIYIEAMDSIIYASALVAKADYLFTADKYLRETVNYICDPNDTAPYGEVKEKLRQLIGDMTLGNADEVELPSAHMITADGTVEPGILTPEHQNSS